MVEELQPTEPEADREDDVYALDQQAVARIIHAVDNADQSGLLSELEPLHPADIADLMEQINAFDRRRLIELYGHEFEGDVLSELDDAIREEVINILNPEVLAEAVRDLGRDTGGPQAARGWPTTQRGNDPRRLATPPRTPSANRELRHFFEIGPSVRPRPGSRSSARAPVPKCTSRSSSAVGELCESLNSHAKDVVSMEAPTPPRVPTTAVEM